jgi:hypothetical protein
MAASWRAERAFPAVRERHFQARTSGRPEHDDVRPETMHIMVAS